MPVPAILNNPVAYGNVWNGALVVGPRARIGGRGAGVVSKTFHAYCPGLMNSHTQIGGNHLGSKSDEIETKSF